MRTVTPTDDNAPLLIFAAKGSAPWSQMVRATPKNETGGSEAILCAVGTETCVSTYGTVKLLAMSARRTTVKSAARARMAEKLAKKIARRDSGRGTRLA